MLMGAMGATGVLGEFSNLLMSYERRLAVRSSSRLSRRMRADAQRVRQGGEPAV